MEKEICHRCKKEKIPFKVLQITSSDGTKENMCLCAECVEDLLKFHTNFGKNQK